VKAIEESDGSLRLEYAGLARGEDPALESAVAELADRHTDLLLSSKTATPASEQN
jgi:cytochrome c biogenesis protein